MRTLSSRSRYEELQDLIDEQPFRAGNGHRASQLSRLCTVLTNVVPARGASVTTSLGDRLPMVLATSDAEAEELDELQHTLGQGPCVDVERLRRPVFEPDLAHHGAAVWPAYAPAAVERGAAAVFGFPLHLGAAHLGVLSAYIEQPGQLSARAVVDCLHLAEIAKHVLLEDLDRDGFGEISPRWADVLPTPHLYQAQGMVMVQLDADPVDALARIRAYAYVNDQRISDVARGIVEGVVKLKRDER